MEEKSGKKNHGGGIMEQDFWEAFGKHLGCIWEAFGKHLGRTWEASEKHLGDIWEAFVETWAAGRADRRKIMGINISL